MVWILGILVVVVVVVVLVRVSVSKAPKVNRSSPRGPVSGPRRSGGTQSPPAAHSRMRPGREFPLTWFGRDAELEVAGVRLKAPCVYASSSSGNGHLWATDPSEILLHAPVRRPSGPPEEMGYWPWYSRVDAGHRYEYLSWLASGRTRLPPCEGYLFLYFYGIERRLLVDEADREWGLREIVRLRRLDEARMGTTNGRSFRQYSAGLLWYEIARTPEFFDQKALDLAMSLTERWTPELLTAPLAWLASKGQPLPAAMARRIAASDPSAQRSVVLKRVTAEFEELFDTRYRETFGGEGMTLRVSKRSAWHTYRPASGGLSEMRCEVANPLGIPSQFKKLPDIWNSCIADLRRLSRVAASVGDRALTVEAWEAMPLELRADVDHPLADRVTAVLADVAPTAADDDGDGASAAALVPAGRFADMMGIERRPKLTATQSKNLAATIEFTGYGLVPDARVSPIRYGWDELVAVVPGLDDDDIEPTRFNAAACVLRLGLSIALADGEADQVELRMLTDHIDAVFDLSPEEQQRLAALRDLLLKTGSDIASVARKIEESVPPDARRKVGRLLVVIAASTNSIDRNERGALRKAFRALGLPPELLEETIAEVAPESDEAEVRVRPASRIRDAGEPIPSGVPSFRLNHEAISSIMSETREVSLMLAAAMGAADAEAAGQPAIEPVVAATEASVSVAEVAGPGARYQPLFIALIERNRWDRQDADGIARSHGLMLDAGVESINDWAYDALGAPLIEDGGDELILDRSLLKGHG